jgi:hypothetical protein
MWRFGPTRFGENSRDGVNGRLNRPSTRTAVERSADMSCDESAPRHHLLFAQPASACRRFSIWHYDAPQPCPIARPDAQAAPAPSTSKLPLPALKCRTASRVWQKTMAVGDSTRRRKFTTATSLSCVWMRPNATRSRSEFRSSCRPICAWNSFVRDLCSQAASRGTLPDVIYP